MLVIVDALDAFYLGSFLFGFLFSACSYLLGFAHLGHGVKGWHVHVQGHAHGAAVGKGAVQQPTVGPINPASILAFVSWFGGVGYQARHALGVVTPVSLLCGIAGGTVAGSIVWLFLAKVILPYDRALDPEDFRLPGTVARVSSSIRVGGTGEIVYEQGGVRQVSAARAGDGLALSRGSQVVILDCARGIAEVRALPESVVGGAGSGGRVGQDGHPTHGP